MLKARGNHKAFHPTAGQMILNLGPALFALVRTSHSGRGVLCLQSVTGSTQNVAVPPEFDETSALYDLIGDRSVAVTGGSVTLAPWEVLWLEKR